MSDDPIETLRETVRPEWCDYNGHMNLAYYVLIFDFATDGFYPLLGLGAAYRERTNCSTFTVETHTFYLAELVAGQQVICTTQLLGFDEKRMHYFHRMFEATSGALSATTEQTAVHVDLGTRRVCAMPEAVQDRLAAIFAAHARLDRPAEAARPMGLARRRRK